MSRSMFCMVFDFRPDTLCLEPETLLIGYLDPYGTSLSWAVVVVDCSGLTSLMVRIL